MLRSTGPISQPVHRILRDAILAAVGNEKPHRWETEPLERRRESFVDWDEALATLTG